MVIELLAQYVVVRLIDFSKYGGFMRGILLLLSTLILTGCYNTYLTSQTFKQYDFDKYYDKIQVKYYGSEITYRNREVNKSEKMSASYSVELNKSEEINDKDIILKRRTPGIIKAVKDTTYVDTVRGYANKKTRVTITEHSVFVDFGLSSLFEFKYHTQKSYKEYPIYYELSTDTLKIDDLVYTTKPPIYDYLKFDSKRTFKRTYNREKKKIKGVTLPE